VSKTTVASTILRPWRRCSTNSSRSAALVMILDSRPRINYESKSPPASRESGFQEFGARNTVAFHVHNHQTTAMLAMWADSSGMPECDSARYRPRAPYRPHRLKNIHGLVAFREPDTRTRLRVSKRHAVTDTRHEKAPQIIRPRVGLGRRASAH